MQILNLSKIRKLVIEILLASLLMYICDDDDPTFDGAHGCRVGVGRHRGVFSVRVLLLRGGRRIDVHFGVGHDCDIEVARGVREMWLWWVEIVQKLV
jgi:hypothetical protein